MGTYNTLEEATASLASKKDETHTDFKGIGLALTEAGAPEPTATPTPEATATPEPTATPESTPTPEPTATPTPR